MSNFLKKWSMVPKGLKYKTMIAFALMSLIPLLICFWLVLTYIFPNINLFWGLSMGNISFILGVSLFIALLGFYITREMIDPVIKMAGEAKDIVEGDLDKKIEVVREDEIGELSASLNIMTQKIKENMEELKAYGEKTKLINIEINKKVLALSSLLQIGNFISQAGELQEVLNFIVQKVSDVEEGTGVFVLMLDEGAGRFKLAASSNINEEKGASLTLSQNEAITRVSVVDMNHPAESDILKNILSMVGFKNIIVLPIIVSRKVYGALGVGNDRAEFAFKEDEKELLKVFVKQAAIAVENDLLIKKAKELAIKDELTGLYNQSYMHSRLDEEIKRACLYQRPCGYLLIDIDNFKDFHQRFGETKAEMLLKTLGEVVKGAVTEVDKVGRLTADRFAVLLPERNKKQAASIAENIRKKVETNLGKIMNVSRRLTVSVAVSENPIDGSTADELMERAEQLVKKAKSLGRNRVEA